jgi:glycosyltransferase involved in cell wall biosynthesis
MAARADRPRLLFVVNEAFFFISHRLAVAQAAVEVGYDVHIAAPVDHVWAPNGFDHREIEKLGFEFHPIGIDRRGLNPLRDVRTLLALARLYRSLRPDIVHHITIKPIIYGGIAARMSNVPAVLNLVTGLGQVFTGSGLAYSILRRAVIAAYRISAAHRNQFMMFQNAGDRDRLVAERVVVPEKTGIVPGSGVNTASFTMTPEPDGTQNVLLAGRLLWEKGVGEFVEAARLLKSRGCKARFVLVGLTNELIARAVPRSDIAEWVDSGLVEWWGRREDMPAVLASSSVVCIPTYYGEGVPKILLEAMASGRAVVASSVAGCREVIDDGVNGVLVAPRDGHALADAIESLLSVDSQRRLLGENARDRAEREFSEQSVAATTIEIYEGLSQVAALSRRA